MDVKKGFSLRSLAVLGFLGFISGFLYSFFWLYQSNRELKLYYPQAPNPQTCFQIFLFAIGMYGVYFLLDFLPEIAKGAATNALQSLLLWSFIPLYIWYFIYVFLYSHVAQTVTGKVSGFSGAVLLGIFPPLGSLYFQRIYNKVARGEIILKYLPAEQWQEGDEVQSEVPTKEERKLETEENLGENEKHAKAYIEKYRSEFSREALQKALISTGIPEKDLEEYLDKYY
ncbi:hypothetical protein H6501_03390 [Candidatus Woesearchaeota archaeon]|nr:hypothetical protein [Nanoarchaeota archaeon]MCB9370613.1 hypothetical protein [Candidatus Woesearchaeota archaeon]USN43697.1 MAG: hypothetical protein H6500_04890 [Candidatus Woesearchaeota archaeon]